MAAAVHQYESDKERPGLYSKTSLEWVTNDDLHIDVEQLTNTDSYTDINLLTDTKLLGKLFNNIDLLTRLVTDTRLPTNTDLRIDTSITVIDLQRVYALFRDLTEGHRTGIQLSVLSTVTLLEAYLKLGRWTKIGLGFGDRKRNP